MVKLGIALAAIVVLPLHATELRVACYSDGNECDVLKRAGGAVHRGQPGTTITVDQVPYKTILESLPVQLAAGNGPDIARVTDFGDDRAILARYPPHLPDAAYWERNFGATLAWMRTQPADQRHLRAADASSP